MVGKWLLRLVIIALVIIGIAWTGKALLSPTGSGGGNWRGIEKKTVELLKSEAMAFLVTDKVSTSVIVEIAESSPWLGIREGYLLARVRIYYGVVGWDGASIRREGGKVVVIVPNPKLLDFSVDFEKSRFLSKRSGLVALSDLIQDKNLLAELYQRLQEETFKQVPVPSRDDLVRRLNLYSPILGKHLGVEVIFT